MLVSSSYTFADTHNFVSDVSAYEIAVTGYTGGYGGAGRKAVASPTVVEDDTNDRAEADCADHTWSALGAGATIGGAVFFREGASDAASPLLFFQDVTDTATNGSDFTLSHDAEGVLQVAKV